MSQPLLPDAGKSNDPILRVATRTSNLASRQVEEVFGQFPGIPYQLVPLQSYGDKNKKISLLKNTIQDFFTRELDIALRNHEADIAVHSAKDLPYPMPDGLEVIALFAAFDKTDSIVSRGNLTLAQLPANPKLGTSSELRKAELLKLRSDIRIVSIRGTIEERIEQVDKGDYDAVIVATCALKRLQLNHRIAEVLPFETHPLQGNLAVVARTEDADKYRTLFASKDIRQKYGKVWLVGFGPGDPELLTIKGRKALEAAEIIFYDDLTNEKYLDTYQATKVYVGKRKDKHSFEQAAINQLLYIAAESGKTVVRLKGGDPMLFAHGGEEIEYLQQRLIRAEVVPGITAALAAAAFTHVPLTHRGIASAVTLITGHSEKNIHVPESGTMVYYMGASNLPKIAEAILAKGWQPDTPVLLVYNVSGPDQQQFVTTLQKACYEPVVYKTPLLIIVGDVVKLQHLPAENIEKPRFLIAGTYVGEYAKYGRVIHTPFIAIKPLADYRSLSTVLESLSSFQWLIFTSRYAVQYFFETLHHNHKDSRALASLRIASVGAVTSAELLQYGIIPDLQPSNESSEGLVELFHTEGITGQRVLIPRSNIALPVLPRGLTSAGNIVETAVVYENVMPENIETVRPEDVDFVVFSSPSCVENFFEFYGKAFNDHQFIVRGNETRKKLLSYDIRPEQIKPSPATTQS
jgi:uroporphyrinogen III methyltransferase / synthase